MTLVVFFHSFPEVVTGGFVGVDVFFVISGYLIIGHLWREREATGTVNVLAFWSRRIRRLLPAAAVVLIVSLVATLPLVPIQRYPAILEEFWSSVGLVENWTLANLSVDYFQSGRAASPFQHYWSLSVEEQFYIVCPLVLVAAVWIAARLRRPGPRRHTGTELHAARRSAAGFAGVVAVVGAASLVYSVIFTAQDPTVAYFSTLTHVWEFSAGGLLGFAAPSLRQTLARLPGSLRRVAGSVALGGGVSLILLAAFAFDGSNGFPGWRALVPALGAVLVIVSSAVELPRPLALAVAWRPVDFVGAISYSLYLWHWPVLIIAGLLVGGSGAAGEPLMALPCIAVSVLLAWLSKRYVEDPARVIHHPRRAVFRTYVMAAAAVVIVLAVSIAPAHHYDGAKAQAVEAYRTLSGQAQGTGESGPSCVGAGAALQSNPDTCPASHTVGAAEAALTPWLPTLATDTTTGTADTITWNNCPSSFVGHLHTCSYGPKDAAFHIEVVGDSHGFQWAHTILPLALARGWRVTVNWQAGCPLAIAGYYTPGGTGDSEEGPTCQDWQPVILKKIESDKSIDAVVMSSFAHKYAADGQSAKIPGVEKANAAVMRQLVAAGKRVVVMADPPDPGRDIPTCIADAPSKVDPCTTPRSQAVLPDPMAEAARSLHDPRVNLIDITSLMCDAKVCHSVIGGVTAYEDSHHLSSQFLNSLGPAVAPVLDQLAADAR